MHANKVAKFHNDQGKLDALSLNVAKEGEPVWASLPYNAQTKTFDESHPLTIQFRAWERENGSVELADKPPSPPPASLPNWDAFFVQAYQSPVYLRITEQNPLAKQRAVTRLENLLGNRPYYLAQYQLLIRFWDEAVNGIVPPFSASEITALNAIALSNSMPFKFDGTGKMVLL